MHSEASTTPTRGPRRKVDPSTIVRLYHEEGQTISSVAEACGVCTATVKRYLSAAKNVGQIEPTPKPMPAPVTTITPEPADSRPKQLVESKIELKGKTAVFEIDLETSTLFVRGSTFEMLMSREEVAQFIGEMAEAYQSMPCPAQCVKNGG